MRKYGKGWYNESERHRLSRLGIKTGRKTNYSLGISYNSDVRFNAGDTAGGQVIPGNKVRLDFTGQIIRLDKDQLKDIKVGDRVTLNFGGPNRVEDVEKEEEFTNEYSDEIDDDTLKLFLTEVGSESDDIKDVKYDDGAIRIEVGNEEWLVFESDDKAEEYALERVRDDLENEPELFTQSWLQQHISFSETDINMMSSEQGDNYAYDIKDEDNGKRVSEEAGMLDEYEEIVNEIDSMTETSESDAQIKESLNDAEKRLQEVIDNAVEKVSEKISDTWEEGLERDPFDFLVNEQGIYTPEDFFKQFGYAIDIDEAAQDAIDTDGWQHFVATYDGNSTELKNGKVIVRVN